VASRSGRTGGNIIMDRLDRLARCSEEDGALTRLFLTAAHEEAGALVMSWMREAGMTADFDAAGNVVGRYEAAVPGRPTLLLGSHLDSVRDAGRYDGAFGVVAAIACVAALHDAGTRLPFAIEVLAFGDEEGVRFQSTLVGSRAVAGTLDPAVLESRDAEGITMAAALGRFGLDPAALPAVARRPEAVIAYVEPHIEQGPVLEAEGLPVGVVDAIAGASRYAVTLTGQGGHAGTVPMTMRRDALAAAAEAVLAIEGRCRAEDGVVGTVGTLEVVSGAANVIPGAVRFSIDLRSRDDGLRRRTAEAVLAELADICARRDIRVAVTPTHDADATVCDARLTARLEQAIAAHGLTPRRLTSGAGHDAMAMAALTPVAMLFLRCRGGVSHHPDEAITAEDAEMGVRVLLAFLHDFAEDWRAEDGGAPAPAREKLGS